MSNSIWHDRYVELPEDVFANCVRPCVIAVDENKKFIGANYGLRGSIPEIKYWARVDDLIAQADKAERLQKAVDNSREKLAAYMHDVWGNWFAYQLNNSTVENLQRWGIQSNTTYYSLSETDKDKDRRFADRIIEIIKDEIKQMIKGE